MFIITVGRLPLLQKPSICGDSYEHAKMTCLGAHDQHLYALRTKMCAEILNLHFLMIIAVDDLFQLCHCVVHIAQYPR